MKVHLIVNQITWYKWVSLNFNSITGMPALIWWIQELSTACIISSICSIKNLLHYFTIEFTDLCFSAWIHVTIAQPSALKIILFANIYIHCFQEIWVKIFLKKIWLKIRFYQKFFKQIYQIKNKRVFLLMPNLALIGTVLDDRV